MIVRNFCGTLTVTATVLGGLLVGPAANAEIYQKWGGSTVRSNGTSVTESIRNVTGAFSSRQTTNDSSTYTLLPECNCTGSGGQTGNQTTIIQKVVEESQQWTEQVRNSTNLTIEAEDWTEFRFIGSGSLFN